jgi:chemotaxis protein MotB
VAKRRQYEEHENHERWLVSYADFITLLFAFFVVMYSVSKVDNKRLAQVVHAIKFAMHFKGTGGVEALPIFEGPPSEGGCVAQTGTGEKVKPVSKARIQAEQIRKRLQKRLDQFLSGRAEVSNAVAISSEGSRLIVRLAAGRFFDANHAAIRPEMIPVLDLVASELTALQRPTRVEGHTDDSRSNTRRFRDNWELSSSRASAVVSYMERAHRFPGSQLLAAGHGSTRPLQSNGTQAGREANRRIEMVVEVTDDAPEAQGR